MSGEYWLADSEARVLGPVSLDVVRDLSLRGKLRDVRAVSRDGKTFVPLREMPELSAVLGQPAAVDEALRAQGVATRQIRDWLEAIKDHPTHEVFRVPPQASREALRAAFFALVHRYVPGRLPPDATPELRLACEDAFLQLSERMVDLERSMRAAPPPGIPPVAATSALPQVSWRGGMIHVRLALPRGDARPFTADPESNWKSDSFFVASTEKVLVNTPAEITISFEGHVTQMHASGRVVGVKAGPVLGFAVKMLDLDEGQRSMIRTWVTRSSR